MWYASLNSVWGLFWMGGFGLCVALGGVGMAWARGFGLVRWCFDFCVGVLLICCVCC